MVGATRGELSVTITVGCAPVMGISCPPPPAPVCASVVQVVTPGEVRATASKVNITLSPGFSVVLPPLAVRLIEFADSVELQDDGMRIVIGDVTVNPVGIATFVDPSVLLTPVFVIVTVYGTS